MIRGSTVPIRLKFDDQDVDFTLADEGTLYVSLKQLNKEEMRFTPEVESEKRLLVYLTQEQSLSLNYALLEIQVNMLVDGMRYPSKVKSIKVTEQLLNEVIG